MQKIVTNVSCGDMKKYIKKIEQNNKNYENGKQKTATRTYS